jgi:hypothetical protein
MRHAKRNVGSTPAPVRRGAQGLFACVALAIAYVLMVVGPTLAPAPAAAQFGGFGNIHVFIGGGHWRGRHSGRSHRHSRHREKDKDEQEAGPSVPSSPSAPSGASASNPPTPSAPPGPPAGARPEPRAPNFEPKE